MFGLKYIIFISIFFSSFYGIAQKFNAKEQVAIDSLQLITNSLESHDTSRASAYVALSEILYVVKFDTLKSLCLIADSIANEALANNVGSKVKNSLLKSKAMALNNIGVAIMTQGKISEALDYYHSSLRIMEEVGDQAGVASALNNIGSIYEHQGDIPKALEYYHNALKIDESLNLEEGASSTLSNIGLIYLSQNKFSEALNNFNKALDIYKNLDDKRGVAGAFNNIGLVHSSKSKKKGVSKEAKDSLLNVALGYYFQSLSIREEIGNGNSIANSLNNIAQVYRRQGNSSEALSYIKKALTIYENSGNKNGLVNSYSALAKAELESGDLNKALNYGLLSLELAQEIGYPDKIRNAATNLVLIYEKRLNDKKALEMYRLFTLMRDSVNNAETLSASATQSAKYKYEKKRDLDEAEHDKQKALDDVEHEKKLAIEHREKETQQVITVATAVGLILVVIFLIFVFSRLQITKKQKFIIEEQKQKVERQKEVVEFAHSELEEKNQEILDSISYAKRIQNAILPPAKVVKEYLQNSFILYKPKDIVAGDFYWIEHKEGKVLFAAADCTGHGVPGAMVSVVCNNSLNRSVREYGLIDPGKILDKTREIVIQEFEKSEEDVKDGMDIALCSLEGMKLKYAGAHNPLWIIRNNEIIETKANKQPIGKFDKQTSYTTHSFDLEAGDAIYIFSDGYVDQFGGEKGKKFKAKAFRELLLSIHDKPMEEQKVVIDTTFEAWRGSLEQIDDVCVIGVKV